LSLLLLSYFLLEVVAIEINDDYYDNDHAQDVEVEVEVVDMDMEAEEGVFTMLADAVAPPGYR
tara:strand:+ start:329 stop:517 length:189 start_codon:yes stop_codon:yes gene_type:complete